MVSSEQDMLIWLIIWIHTCVYSMHFQCRGELSMMRSLKPLALWFPSPPPLLNNLSAAPHSLWYDLRVLITHTSLLYIHVHVCSMYMYLRTYIPMHFVLCIVLSLWYHLQRVRDTYISAFFRHMIMSGSREMCSVFLWILCVCIDFECPKWGVANPDFMFGSIFPCTPATSLQ